MLKIEPVPVVLNWEINERDDKRAVADVENLEDVSQFHCEGRLVGCWRWGWVSLKRFGQLMKCFINDI